MGYWTSHKTINFTLDDWDYKAEVILRCHEEIYGQDADGNRGMWTSFIDDVEIINVMDIYGLNVIMVTQEMENAIIDSAYNCDISELERDNSDEEAE